ncbi:hypothetical protein NE686_17600 [Tissierella carlieri]|uniref:Uncharacterized protein n=1 Tax=Tissierella carlieri TaxID=689904 RepID=A0ABT1SEK7_9FIRM|nr:hypothetical protein [Tissierella carlieri]MCQ4924921.1 hypothetical protein [Tissierella carlieri]
MKNRIIIEVEGGIVTSVYSNLKELNISVLDKDYCECDDPDFEKEREELIEEASKLKEHY